MGKIYKGDCFNILPKLADNSVDMTLFSPPYDKIRDYKGGFTLLTKENREKLAKEILRVSKDGAVCIVVIQDQTIDGLKSGTSDRWAVEWMDQGWGKFETCIYRRHGPPGVFWKKRFRVDHEYVHIFLKGNRPNFFDKEHMMIKAKSAGKMVSCDKRHKDGHTEDGEDFLCPDMKCLGTVWDYPSSNREGNAIKKRHPASFPDPMASDVIRCFSKPGDMILDPMVGSGTTCIMAAKNKRNYTGIECSEEYIEIIKERFEKEISTNLFEESTEQPEFII